MTFRMHRITAAAVLVVMLASIVTAPLASFAATAGDDLKQIEYRYYFRGRYQQSIEALQTFLARVDLTPAETMRAREVLAASYVLGGAPAMGQGMFAQMIEADPAYPGPDPTVFKLEVVNAYAQARAEYAARTLKTVPAPGAGDAAAGDVVAAEAAGKPIYKKWWFYAGAAALLAGVGVAAASGGDDPAPGAATGSVTVGVTLR
jgi:hypothetical protein